MSSCLQDNLRSSESLAVQFADVPREIGGGLGKFLSVVGIGKVCLPFKSEAQLYNRDINCGLFLKWSFWVNRTEKSQTEFLLLHMCDGITKVMVPGPADGPSRQSSGGEGGHQFHMMWSTFSRRLYCSFWILFFFWACDLKYVPSPRTPEMNSSS